MAYDGSYRSTPDHHQSFESNDPRRSYTVTNGADELARTKSPPTMREGAYPASYAASDPSRPRSRQSSKDRGNGHAPRNARYSQPQQPINDAVSSALHDKVDMSSSIPPEVLAQITESVIKQLQSTTLNGGISMPSQQQYYPPPPPQQNIPLHQPIPTQQPIPISPSTTHSASSPSNPTRNVYTPPSSQRHPDYVLVGSPAPPPDPTAYKPPPSPPRQFQPGERRAGSRMGTAAYSEETPESVRPNDYYTPPSPRKHSPPEPTASEPLPTHSRQPFMSQPDEHRSTSRASVASHSSETTNHVRPKGPTRLSTSKEETTLEKIWGQLFDEHGHSTVRLGQFLRGLAIHLIEDYEPRYSLVVTPPKMVKFYQDVALSNELYPWNDVFDDDQTAISRMYRELECSHHLVQERNDLRPDIPGLTPEGFERWATLMIKAYPEKEYERLQKAVLEMPISNPDDKKERFPKELSRRLFPGGDDRDSSDRVERAIAEHAHLRPTRDDHDNTPKPPKTQSPPPPPKKPEVVVDNEPAFEPPYASNGIERERKLTQPIERERKPYSSIPSEGAKDDCNPPPIIQPAVTQPIEREQKMTQPIERERKPYVAQPGGGKKHEDELRKQSDDTARYGSTGGKMYEDDLGGSSRHRAASVAQSNPTSTRPVSMAAYPSGKALPSDVAPDIHHHTNPHVHRASVSTARHRRVSPSGNDYRRSDTDLRTYPPPPVTHQSSSMSNSEHYEDVEKPYRRPSFRDEGGRHYERASRKATLDEEAINGAYGTPPRAARYDARYNGNEEDYYRRERDAREGRQGSGYEYGAYGGNVYRN